MATSALERKTQGKFLNMKQIFIQNLKCGGCASTITKKLSSLNIVKTVQVNVEEAKVEVELFDENALSNIKAKLSSLGYPEQTEKNSIGKKAKSVLSCSIGKLS